MRAVAVREGGGDWFCFSSPFSDVRVSGSLPFVQQPIIHLPQLKKKRNTQNS